MQPDGEADGETEEGGVAGPEGTGTVVQVEGGSTGAFENPLAQDESPRRKARRASKARRTARGRVARAILSLKVGRRILCLVR
jgi:hypothetical protein